LLSDFASVRRQVVKVMPREYKRALADQVRQRNEEQEPLVEQLVVTGVVRSASSAETAVHG
jgi:tRNA isopentenyl-2-thiomethyl-A-37 hydroxylase MiaE